MIKAQGSYGDHDAVEL